MVKYYTAPHTIHGKEYMLAIVDTKIFNDYSLPLSYLEHIWEHTVCLAYIDGDVLKYRTRHTTGTLPIPKIKWTIREVDDTSAA